MEEFYQQIENSLDFPMYRTPLFSFNPNLFPNVLTYEQPTVIMEGKTLVSLETARSEVSTSTSTSGASGTKIRTRVKFPRDLEKNADEVKKTLTSGCYCLSKNCLIDLDSESVYRHRVSVSKLTKPEYNMFIMGAVMTCLTTSKALMQKTYIKYAYKGRRVCKEAFIYLHCSTHQQLRDIRDHITIYGVCPVTYSAPNNMKHTLYFKRMYKSLKEFLSKFVEKHVGMRDIEAGQYIFLPLGITKKSLHRAFKMYIQRRSPEAKCIGYSTFTNLLVNHFPHIIFYRFGRGVTLSQFPIENDDVETVTGSESESLIADELSQDRMVVKTESSSEVYDDLFTTTYTNSLENIDPGSFYSDDKSIISGV